MPGAGLRNLSAWVAASACILTPIAFATALTLNLTSAAVVFPLATPFWLVMICSECAKRGHEGWGVNGALATAGTWRGGQPSSERTTNL